MCRVDLNVFARRSKQRWELKDVEAKGCSSACLVICLIYCPCLLCTQPFLSPCDDTQPVCNKGFPSRAGPIKTGIKRDQSGSSPFPHILPVEAHRRLSRVALFPSTTFTDFIFSPFSLIFRACWGLYHLLLAFLLVSLIVAIRVRLVAMRGKSQRRTQWRTGGKSSQEAACQGIYWMLSQSEWGLTVCRMLCRLETCILTQKYCLFGGATLASSISSSCHRFGSD